MHTCEVECPLRHDFCCIGREQILSNQVNLFRWLRSPCLRWKTRNDFLYAGNTLFEARSLRRFISSMRSYDCRSNLAGFCLHDLLCDSHSTRFSCILDDMNTPGNHKSRKPFFRWICSRPEAKDRDERFASQLCASVFVMLLCLVRWGESNRYCMYNAGWTDMSHVVLPKELKSSSELRTPLKKK